jgi:hypothetical protein
MHGHLCNVVATGHNKSVVGHAGQVVCGLSGHDTLTATGPGKVILIAGHSKTTLRASSDPNAHDVLIEGSGRDTAIVGSGGDDIVETGTGNDTTDCSTGGSVTVVDDNQGDDNSQGDQNQDSQGDDNQGDDNSQEDCTGDGNVTVASQEWGGTITALPSPTTMTVQWSDVNDTAQTWLDSLTPPDPTTVTFDISTASVEVDGGGSLSVGDDVEVAANPPASGTMPVAVDVQSDPQDAQ